VVFDEHILVGLGSVLEQKVLDRFADRVELGGVAEGVVGDFECAHEQHTQVERLGCARVGG